MDRPQDIVFYTFELLEQILFDLERGDLYRCQRICQQFRGVILNSSVIRQQMWTAPCAYSPGKEELVYTSSYDRELRDWIKTKSPYRNIHEFLQVPNWRGPVQCCRSRGVRYSLCLPKPVAFNASWRKMYLTQPPVMAVHAHLTWRSRPVENKIRVVRQIHGDFCDPDGLTIGSLIDLIMSEEASCTAACSLCGAWHREENCENERVVSTNLMERWRHVFDADEWSCHLQFDVDGGSKIV